MYTHTHKKNNFFKKRSHDFERGLGTWKRLRRNGVDIGDVKFLIKLIFKRESWRASSIIEVLALPA